MIVDGKSTCAAQFYERAQNLVTNLWARWQDEKEHEDLQSYAGCFNALAQECGVVVVRMNKRPFGLEFWADERRYQIACNGREYKYGRVK